MKTEAYKLYSRVFWIFLPNFIKIDHYNFELYRFKVCAFFETHCTSTTFTVSATVDARADNRRLVHTAKQRHSRPIAATAESCVWTLVRPAVLRLCLVSDLVIHWCFFNISVAARQTKLWIRRTCAANCWRHWRITSLKPAVQVK